MISTSSNGMPSQPWVVSSISLSVRLCPVASLRPFTARRSYVIAVLAVVILSVTQLNADILIPHERAITPVFWHQQWWVGGDAPSVSELLVTIGECRVCCAGALTFESLNTQTLRRYIFIISRSNLHVKVTYLRVVTRSCL